MQERGFVYLRNNELRYNITEMLGEVISDVQVDPALKLFSDEEIKGDQSENAISDIRARGF